MRLRIWFIGVSLAIIALTHWVTPTGDPHEHTVHVLMRKMFLAPVIIAAVWFGYRGALIAAGAATALYLPHVLYQWRGNTAENVNQIGEIASIWIAAVVAGLLVQRVRKGRLSALEGYRTRLEALIQALEAQLERFHFIDRRGSERDDRDRAA